MTPSIKGRVGKSDTGEGWSEFCGHFYRLYLAFQQVSLSWFRALLCRNESSWNACECRCLWPWSHGHWCTNPSPVISILVNKTVYCWCQMSSANSENLFYTVYLCHTSASTWCLPVPHAGMCLTKLLWVVTYHSQQYLRYFLNNPDIIFCWS